MRKSDWADILHNEVVLNEYMLSHVVTPLLAHAEDVPPLATTLSRWVHTSSREGVSIAHTAVQMGDNRRLCFVLLCLLCCALLCLLCCAQQCSAVVLPG